MRHLVAALSIVVVSACAGDHEPASRLTVSPTVELRSFASLEPDAVGAMLPVLAEARIVESAHRIGEHEQVVETVLCLDGAPDRALDSVTSRFEEAGWQSQARGSASVRLVRDRWDVLAVARTDDACPRATTIAIGVVQHR